MKTFASVPWSAVLCRKQLKALQKLLASSTGLKEREEILPFFKARPQLSAFLGSYDSTLFRYDLLAYEFELFGDFVCDLAVGDSVRKAYGFIEFEDAVPNSIFVKKERQE
jgi:hypothetical protein